MYLLKLKHHFDSAHRLDWHEGKCKNLHGHRWEVEVRIEVENLDSNGVIVDFGKIKELLPDHQYLNDLIPNPTAENISHYLYGLVRKLFGDFHSLEVEVWESPGASVTYYES